MKYGSVFGLAGACVLLLVALAAGSDGNGDAQTASPEAHGKIAFSRGGDIFIMNTDGSDPVNLSTNLVSDEDPAWAPNGRRIAFTRNFDWRDAKYASFDIFVMNADGSGPRRLTRHPRGSGDRVPAWSPDGRRIAFSSDRSLNSDIWVMNADGRGLRNLTRSPGDDYSPAWSPDGTKIAFTRDSPPVEGGDEIFVMNADGSGHLNLTKSSAREGGAAWSPSGAQIAFTSREGGGSDIFVMDANGGSRMNLTNAPRFNSHHPAWSPDGTRIVFVRFDDGDGDNVWVMNADGSEPRNLTPNGIGGGTPAWGMPPPLRLCSVPHIVGLRFVRASSRIRRANCSVGRVAFARAGIVRGRVIRQNPPASTRLRRGARVNLVVSQSGR